VWSALTDPRRLAGWLGEGHGDLRPAGDFRAYFFACGSNLTGHVEACEPPERLVVRIKDADMAEEEVIEVTLAADADGTILVAEERGMPLELVAAYGAGVQIHVEDLAAHLAGRERNTGARWDELMPAYRELAAGVS